MVTMATHAPVHGTQQTPRQGLGLHEVPPGKIVPLHGVPSGIRLHPPVGSQQTAKGGGGQGLGEQAVVDVTMVPAHGTVNVQAPVIGSQQTCCGHGLGVQEMTSVPPTATQYRSLVKMQALGQQHPVVGPTHVMATQVWLAAKSPLAAAHPAAPVRAHPVFVQQAPNVIVAHAPGTQVEPTP